MSTSAAVREVTSSAVTSSFQVKDAMWRIMSVFFPFDAFSAGLQTRALWPKLAEQHPFLYISAVPIRLGLKESPWWTHGSPYSEQGPTGPPSAQTSPRQAPTSC